MLVIRLQRTGRSGHAMFRVVVQDSRKSPTSGKVIALVGNYDPHAKKINLKKEKIEQYLANGAQPSNKVIYLLEKEGVKLPEWVEKSLNKERSVRNPEKRRSTTPKEEVVSEPANEEAVAQAATEAPAEATPEVSEEAPKEEVKE